MKSIPVVLNFLTHPQRRRNLLVLAKLIVMFSLLVLVFTVTSESVAIAATAASAASVDILQLAGCNQVLQFGGMLGQALARRILGRDACWPKAEFEKTTGCNVVAVVQGDRFDVNPDARQPLRAETGLVVIGDIEAVFQILDEERLRLGRVEEAFERRVSLARQFEFVQDGVSSRDRKRTNAEGFVGVLAGVGHHRLGHHFRLTAIRCRAAAVKDSRLDKAECQAQSVDRLAWTRHQRRAGLRRIRGLTRRSASGGGRRGACNDATPSTPPRCAAG